jgi:hypothetical protein
MFAFAIVKTMHMARRGQKLWYEFYAQNFLLQYIGQSFQIEYWKIDHYGEDYFLKTTEIGSLGVLLKRANW